VIDASGKPPSGLLYGRLADYGNYEECLDVKHPQNSFQGQYCMLHLEANGKITPLMNMYVDYGYKYAGLHYIGNVSGFLQNENRDFFPLFKLGVCIPSTCSKEDLQFILDVGLLSKVLMGFSLRRAALKLTSVPNWGDYSNELGFVHGMRVFSATWVIQGHHYLLRDI
ncbi:unnamed protein product, partial [Ixodes persulcatus]